MVDKETPMLDENKAILVVVEKDEINERTSPKGTDHGTFTVKRIFLKTPIIFGKQLTKADPVRTPW